MFLFFKPDSIAKFSDILFEGAAEGELGFFFPEITVAIPVEGGFVLLLDILEQPFFRLEEDIETHKYEMVILSWQLQFSFLKFFYDIFVAGSGVCLSAFF